MSKQVRIVGADGSS